MENSYNVRTQKIEGSKGPVSGRFSSVLEGSQDSGEQLEQRGRLFAVIELSGSEGSDLKLAMTLVKNTISEAYFGNLDGTPLTALEKAVLDAKERISNLSGGGLTGEQITIGLGAVVLWGNVVYLAQIGDSQTLLLRNSEVVTLGEETGGDVKLRSSVLEDGDVFVCATGEFLRKFSVDFILKNSLKIEEEIAAFNDSHRLSACVISVSSKVVLSPRNFIKIAYPISKKGTRVNKKKVMVAVSSFVGLLFLVGGLYGANKTGILKRSYLPEKPLEKESVVLEVSKEEVTYAKPLLEFSTLDNIYASKIYLDGEDIQIADFKAGKIVSVKEDGTKIKSEDLTGLTKQIPENYAGIATYLDNWYVVSPSAKIVKVVESSGEFLASDWLKEEVTGLQAEDIAVDYYVYVLMGDGTVSRFLSGETTEFSLSLGEEKIKNPSKIYTDSDIKNIYIWDQDDNSVFIFNKSGGFVKKSKIADPLKEEEILSMFVVEKDVTTIYLATKSFLYKFDI